MSDRAQRLRQRRKRSAEKVRSDEPDEPVKQVKPDKTDKTDKQGKTSKPDKPDDEVTPAKDRGDWGAIQMWIPDDLRDDLELARDETNLELRRAGEEKLEKLLHWYPLVVEAGINAISEMDAEEIEDRAKRFE